MFSFTPSLRHSGLGQLRLVGIRLLLGLMQGLALYALSPVQGQPAPLSDLPYVLLPLQLTVLLLPLLLIDVVGALKGAALWRWGLLAAVLLWALGVHEVWRQGSAVPAPHFSLFQKSGLLLGAGFGFFVAESLLLAGAADQRRMASYATCFDTTWKLLLQWQISVLFVAGLWLVLWFGAANFSLLGLDGPKRLLKQDWFALPLSCSALAFALHLYDQRPALVLGGRTMLLTLLSWMLPLASLAVGGFLLALPWTGLQPLWSTGHASWVLLGTLLALVLLINATLQDCRSDHRPPRVLDWSGRMAVCCLLPLVLIAAYALGLRVADYGWTEERVLGAAGIGVAACYALGYGWALLRPRHWSERLARVNVGNAFVVLALLLLLFSPLADPARLAVQSQRARLESGRVAPSKFDYDYLRFSGLRYGREALEQLQATDPAAAQALQREYPLPKRGEEVAEFQLASQLQVWPAGRQLPPSFLMQNWSATAESWRLPECLRYAKKQCNVYLQANPVPGAPLLALVVERDDRGDAVLMRQTASGSWELTHTVSSKIIRCPGFQQQLQAGSAWQLVPSGRQALLIGRQQLQMSPLQELLIDCPADLP